MKDQPTRVLVCKLFLIPAGNGVGWPQWCWPDNFDLANQNYIFDEAIYPKKTNKWQIGIKTWSASLFIRKIQIKTIRYCHTCQNGYYLKRLIDTVSVGEKVEKSEAFYTVNRNANSAATMKNSMNAPQKIEYRFAIFSNPCCSVAKLCPTLCNAMDCSMPGFPVLRYLLGLLKLMSIEIQPSHPQSPPSPLTVSLFQPQGLFQWISSSHQVASASALVLPMNIQDWFPLGWTAILLLCLKKTCTILFPLQISLNKEENHSLSSQKSERRWIKWNFFL